MIYRIKELKYENGKSEFIPQYKNELCGRIDENGNPYFFGFPYWLHGKYLVDKKVDTYDEALEIINNDKQRYLEPIEEKIHKIN
jgi:hypothetical protein